MCRILFDVVECAVLPSRKMSKGDDGWKAGEDERRSVLQKHPWSCRRNFLLLAQQHYLQLRATAKRARAGGIRRRRRRRTRNKYTITDGGGGGGRDRTKKSMKKNI